MPIVWTYGSLSLLEPSGAVQACNGIVLSLRFYESRLGCNWVAFVIQVHTSYFSLSYRRGMRFTQFMNVHVGVRLQFALHECIQCLSVCLTLPAVNFGT
jgi:hypothetical protein